MRSILRLPQTIWMLLTKNIRKWAASVMKIREWAFILSAIRTDIGWKLFQPDNTSFLFRLFPSDHFVQPDSQD